MTPGILPPEVLKLLACPVCANPLDVAPARSQYLCCSSCARLYPIVDGIPILLADRATITDRPA